MSYCTCYCCQGRGCSRQYIGYFDTYVSNCLSSTCTVMFPRNCIRNTNIGGSISAQFTSYPPQIPNPPNPPSPPSPQSSLTTTLYIILGFFSIIILIALVYWLYGDYKKRRYQRIPENPHPQPLQSQPPPPYSKISTQKQQQRYSNIGSSRSNFEPVYIPVPDIYEPIIHHPIVHYPSPPPLQNTPVHIDIYTVTSSTQDHSYTYCDDGNFVSQTDTDNF